MNRLLARVAELTELERKSVHEICDLKEQLVSSQEQFSEECDRNVALQERDARHLQDGAQRISRMKQRIDCLESEVAELKSMMIGLLKRGSRHFTP